MKKIILILSGLLFFFNTKSQISYTVNINSSDLTISQVTAMDSNIYTKVNITKLYASAEPGNPSLPEPDNVYFWNMQYLFC